jgi:hypothetical protein
VRTMEWPMAVTNHQPIITKTETIGVYRFRQGVHLVHVAAILPQLTQSSTATTARRVPSSASPNTTWLASP